MLWIKTKLVLFDFFCAFFNISNSIQFLHVYYNTLLSSISSQCWLIVSFPFGSIKHMKIGCTHMRGYLLMQIIQLNSVNFLKTALLMQVSDHRTVSHNERCGPEYLLTYTGFTSLQLHWLSWNYSSFSLCKKIEIHTPTKKLDGNNNDHKLMTTH